MSGLTAAEIELNAQTAAILAAENWSKQYSKDKQTHSKLIKIDARLETALIKYFKELSERALTYVHWGMYEIRLRQISAAGEDSFTIDVLISDDSFGKEDAIFIQTTFDPIAQAVALGAQAGEKIYSVELGLSETSEVVQRTAKDLIGDLIGKKIDDNGSVIDNPKAKFRISEKTRADVRQSLSTSLTLGEDQEAAKKRLLKTIKNPKRAETIARTEAVNGYQKGLLVMGQQSGAVGKEWQSVNDLDICGENARQGIIALKETFVSGHSAPAAHPNCRCGLRLVYPEEIK